MKHPRDRPQIGSNFGHGVLWLFWREGGPLDQDTLVDWDHSIGLLAPRRTCRSFWIDEETMYDTGALTPTGEELILPSPACLMLADF